MLLRIVGASNGAHSSALSYRGGDRINSSLDETFVVLRYFVVCRIGN
jgi:hypothetical protein